MANKPGITINGHVIPWSFIMLVKRMCGGDWDQTMDCFFKASKADLKGNACIEKYIMRGFRPDQTGKRYMLIPSIERERPKGMQQIRDWWNTLYETKKPMMSVRDIFSAIAAGGAS